MPIDRNTRFTWLGHSTVLIETPGGVRILVDPWLAGNPACPDRFRTPSSLGRIDIILITHIHSDHVGDAAPVAQANPEALVVGSFEACIWLARHGPSNTRPMNIGGSQNLHGIGVTMTRALHSSSFEEPDGTLVYGGEPAGYILRMENGFTIYCAGDTAVFGDMALLRELYEPKLALLPIGDLFTMGPREAAVAIRLLGVRHVLPIHFGTFPALTGTPAALQSKLPRDSGVELIVWEPGDTVQ